MFDYFLKELNIVVIPGIIFGTEDNYIRISALGQIENSIECIERMLKDEKEG